MEKVSIIARKRSSNKQSNLVHIRSKDPKTWKCVKQTNLVKFRVHWYFHSISEPLTGFTICSITVTGTLCSYHAALHSTHIQFILSRKSSDVWSLSPVGGWWLWSNLLQISSALTSHRYFTSTEQSFFVPYQMAPHTHHLQHEGMISFWPFRHTKTPLYASTPQTITHKYNTLLPHSDWPTEHYLLFRLLFQRAQPSAFLNTFLLLPTPILLLLHLFVFNIFTFWWFLLLLLELLLCVLQSAKVQSDLDYKKCVVLINPWTRRVCL